LLGKYGRCDDFYHIVQPMPPFKENDLASNLIAAADNVKAGLTVMDTHARAMNGGMRTVRKIPASWRA
jgi:hypothetical protein